VNNKVFYIDEYLNMSNRMVAILDLAAILDNFGWAYIDNRWYWCDEHLCQGLSV
jgi:hypothetical protein